MALISYMQRHTSGTYEFRKRLPEALAGKPVPDHMRDAFAELINSHDRLLQTRTGALARYKELREAKQRDHREALRAAHMFDDATGHWRRATLRGQSQTPS
jgi:hypothetical protein